MVVNLLTLDWDYFFTASEEIRKRCFQIFWYENIPLQQALYSWGFSYYDYGEELLDIKVKPEIYDILDKIKLNRSAVVYICNSHTNAYYQFSSFLRKYRKNPRLNLLNVDHHSDTLHEIKGLTGPMDKEVHCGNWLYRFIKENKGNYCWLGNEDSEKIALPSSLKFCTDVKSSRLESFTWDALLICRSDVWSPPHLDDEFTKIFKAYVDGKNAIVLDDEVWNSRYPFVSDIAHSIKEPPADLDEEARKNAQVMKEQFLAIREQFMKDLRINQEMEKIIRKSHPELF